MLVVLGGGKGGRNVKIVPPLLEFLKLIVLQTYIGCLQKLL